MKESFPAKKLPSEMDCLGDHVGRRGSENRDPGAQTMAPAADKWLTCENVSASASLASVPVPTGNLLSNRRRYPLSPNVIALDPPKLIDVRILWRYIPRQRRRSEDGLLTYLGIVSQ